MVLSLMMLTLADIRVRLHPSQQGDIAPRSGWWARLRTLLALLCRASSSGRR